MVLLACRRSETFLAQEDNEERMTLPARSMDHPFIRRPALTAPNRELTHEQRRCACRLPKPPPLSACSSSCLSPGTRRSKCCWARPSWLQACLAETASQLHPRFSSPWEAATASASAQPRPFPRCRCGRPGPRPRTTADSVIRLVDVPWAGFPNLQAVEALLERPPARPRVGDELRVRVREGGLAKTLGGFFFVFFRVRVEIAQTTA